MKITLALIVLVASISGCASITTGSTQSISVQTVCQAQPMPGASCKLSNSKGNWFVAQTPGSVTIHKAYGDLATECTLPQGQKAVDGFQSSSNTGVWGNILVGGLIGYAVDAGTGSGFDYPSTLVVDMCKNGNIVVAASPMPVLPQPPSTPTSMSAPTAASAGNRVETKYQFNAERIAQGSGCSNNPLAKLNIAAPGLETYSFICTNGDALTVRCEYGQCRALR